VFSHTGKDSFSPSPKKNPTAAQNISVSKTKAKTTQCHSGLQLSSGLCFFFFPFLSFQTSTSEVAAPPSNPFEKFSLAVMAAKDVTIGRLLLC